MDEKVEIVVIGLAPSSVPPNTFALLLKEIEGNRCVPIVIGPYEARAIAWELENVQPERPMIYDIIRTIIWEVKLHLSEVFIYDHDGDTFYTKLIFGNDEIEIECRPSDAIAIALGLNTPVFITTDILDKFGMYASVEKVSNFNFSKSEQPNNTKNKLEQLKLKLDRALRNEDFETAAKIRDEIKLFSKD